MKILYIVSTSRSGSTILEHALGSFEDIVNTGELRRLSTFYKNDQIKTSDPKNSVGCTCGKKISNCTFWNKVEKVSGLDFASVKLNSQINLVNRLIFRLFFFIGGPKLLQSISKWYGPFNRELKAAENIFSLYSAIYKITGSHCVVDSSKLLHHFLMLKTLHPKQVGMLLMLRDGRAVSHSMVRGERKKRFQRGKFANDTESKEGRERIFKAAVLSWVRSTVEFLFFFSKISKEERIIIRYERFCRQPETIISNILVQFDMNAVTKKKKLSSSLSHTVGGSPSRFESDFSKIFLDEKWKTSWTWDKKRIFNFYAGWINRLLGYK